MATIVKAANLAGFIFIVAFVVFPGFAISANSRVDVVEQCLNFRDADFEGEFSEELGEKLYRRGYYSEAMLAWSCAFESSSDAGAAYRLAVEYIDGLVVERNLSQALKHLRAGALRGDARAQFELGIFYEEGEAVAADLDQSRFWYFLAAQKGHPAAEYAVGVWHDGGHEGERDKILAFAYFVLADRHGLPRIAADEVRRLQQTMTPDEVARGMITADRIESERRVNWEGR
jgi:TPR repeat protein